MTKQELIETVQISQQAVVNNVDYSYQIIDRIMSTIYAEFVSSYFKRENNTRYFTKDYTLNVLLDSNKNVYYSLYPTKVLYVNDAAGAARFIRPKEDQTLIFVPILDEEYELCKNLSCSTIDKKIKYISGLDRIEYINITQDLVNAGVLSRLVLSWDSYLDNDIIYLPSSIEKTFIQQAIAIYNGSAGIKIDETKKER